MKVNPGKEPGNQQVASAYAQKVRTSYITAHYPVWVRNNRLRASDIKRLRNAVSKFGYKPLVSIVLPVYDPRQEWLERALDTVLSQVYPRWELCICDDGSTKEHVRKTLSRYQNLDDRIKVKYLEQNSGISAASNAALSLATGEFVGLLDHDDELPPDALFEVVRLLQEHPDADLIYTDEDKVDERGNRMDPHFKPDWSPDLLLSANYISHLGVYRRSIVEEIGGFREGFEGAQDYDLVLRFTERTGNIYHVPKILYHWRTVQGSTAHSDEGKDYTRPSAHRALGEALDRRSIQGSVEDGFVPNRFRVRREIHGKPKLSIIIPTRDNVTLLKNCIQSIERLTTYSNYEILVVDNDSKDPATVKYLSATPHRVLHFREEFNFSKINNFGVSQAEGEYILLLNDDTEVVSAAWLEEMLQHAQRPEVGAVGAKLLYPNGRIQHAGVITGGGNAWHPAVATHSHQHYPANAAGHRGGTKLIRNYSAVTGACLMARKSLFSELGGLDEKNLRVNFNDVDFCLRLRELGYLIVYTPYAELYHHESVSRGYKGNPAEFLYMRKQWGEVLDNDPYYNPNFSKGGGDFNLRADSLRPRTLRGEAKQSGAAENQRQYPQEMGLEERLHYIRARQDNARSSHRTTLTPKAVRRDSAPEKARSQQPEERPRDLAASSARRIERRKSTSPPFFVLGQPKSGTSWIRSTLNSHPEIVCLGEGKFFGRDFKTANPSSGGRLPSLYSLFADSEDLKVWTEAAGAWIPRDPNETTYQQELERHTKGLVRAAMDYFFEDAQARFDKAIVGDKTPAHTMYLEEIFEFYPDARIIHIIRDGRDQAVSSVFHWWRESDRAVFSNLDPEILRKKEAYHRDRDTFGPGKQSIFSEAALRGLARGWQENVARVMDLGPRLFAERYFELQYEDLLEHPVELFEKMIRYLGARSARNIVQQCVRKNSFEVRSKNRSRGVEDPSSFFRKGIAGDWKNYFTERDKRVFKEEAGDMLVRLGYEKDLDW